MALVALNAYIWHNWQRYDIERSPSAGLLSPHARYRRQLTLI